VNAPDGWIAGERSDLGWRQLGGVGAHESGTRILDDDGDPLCIRGRADALADLLIEVVWRRRRGADGRHRQRERQDCRSEKRSE
jgi:hypothetical protein